MLYVLLGNILLNHLNVAQFLYRTPVIRIFQSLCSVTMTH